MVDEKAACCCEQARAVSEIDSFQAVHILENLSKHGIRDELHTSQRQHLDVRCHSTDFIKHVVLNPVVVLQIQS